MTYKPNVSDFRESPAIDIYHALAKELGHMAEVRVVDPFLENGGNLLEKLPFVPLGKVSHLDSEDFKILLVPHQAFCGLTFSLDFSQ